MPILAGLIVAAIVCAATTAGMMAFRSRPVQISNPSELPYWFPVVVVHRDRSEAEKPVECRVEFFESVASSQSQRDRFLVNNSEIDECLRSLDTQDHFVDRWSRTLPVWTIHASISPVSAAGEQEFEVLATWDDDWWNRGWYVVDAAGVHPSRYQGFGAGAALSSLVSGLFLGFVAGVVTTIRIWRSR